MFKPLTRLWERIVGAMAKRPVTNFFILLIILFGIIALGHYLRTPKTTTESTVPEAKETTLFDVATDTAFVTVPAKVKKESVVTIVALTPGVVSNILTSPGRSVSAGQTLLTLTNDYQSGSASIQKRLSAESARLTEELAKIDKDITRLEEKRAKNDDNLTKTETSIALERLEKDRATRKSSLEQSALSTQLSNISDAVLKPKTYTSGVVQSIRVRRGDLVSPGQVLATLSTPNGATTLEAFLDPKVARLFDARNEATITIGTETLSLLPTYFSQSENENGLFPVLFTLSPETANKITNGEYLKIALPLHHSEETLTLVPIDAIFQDEKTTSVLVLKDGKAVAQTVTLGNLYGSFAEITSGVSEEDRIILSRAIIVGDSVSAK